MQQVIILNNAMKIVFEQALIAENNLNSYKKQSSKLKKNNIQYKIIINILD